MQQLSKTWHLVWFPYVNYIMYFLGVGLISGGIVHMPMAPIRNSIILFSGTLLFIAATFFNEIFIEKKKLDSKQIIKLLIFSCSLSLGVGMVSGGIQHFGDLGGYAVILIPTGIILSLFSFIIKNNLSLNKLQIALVFTILVLVVSPITVGLSWFVEGPGHELHEDDHHKSGHGH